jgi:hypothetical protein
MNLNQYGGRKFIAAIGAGFVTAFLCWFGKVTDSVYATVVIATVGAFIAGNTIDTHLNTRKPGDKDAGTDRPNS